MIYVWFHSVSASTTDCPSVKPGPTPGGTVNHRTCTFERPVIL